MFWKQLYHYIVKHIWTEQFDILPGMCTRLLESYYNLPKPRSNTYMYLDDNIVLVPSDVFYPFMGTFEYTYNTIQDRLLHEYSTPHTVALHWEHSQIKDEHNNKQGWTNYLSLLRKAPTIKSHK